MSSCKNSQCPFFTNPSVHVQFSKYLVSNFHQVQCPFFTNVSVHVEFSKFQQTKSICSVSSELSISLHYHHLIYISPGNTSGSLTNHSRLLAEINYRFPQSFWKFLPEHVLLSAGNGAWPPDMLKNIFPGMEFSVFHPFATNTSGKTLGSINMQVWYHSNRILKI